MKRCLFLFLLFIPFSSFGQYCETAHPLRPLKNRAVYEQNKSLLLVKDIDSLPYYLVYFINNTNEPVSVRTFDCLLFLNAGINDNGAFKAIPMEIGCGTGLGYSSVPPFHYSWTRFHKFYGDLKTDIQLSLPINDTTILSPVISTFLSLDERLSAKLRLVAYYRKTLLDRGLKKVEKSKIHTQIGKIYLNANLIDSAYVNFQKAIALNKENYDAIYWKGRAFLKGLTTCANKDLKVQQGLLSAAFQVWKRIPPNTEVYQRMRKIRKKIQPSLPTEKEWLQDNKLLKKVSKDDKSLFFIDCVVKDYIEIEFKK